MHDVQAQEVDRATFFSIREDGGTRISSAFASCKSLLDEHYSPDEWNIYLFHFSDGDNSSEADNRTCVQLLREHLLPVCNMFGYCQVTSPYGSGSFINILREAFGDDATHGRDEKVITSRINERDDIFDSLRTLFKAGY